MYYREWTDRERSWAPKVERRFTSVRLCMQRSNLVVIIFTPFFAINSDSALTVLFTACAIDEWLKLAERRKESDFELDDFSAVCMRHEYDYS
jgi:hypothetical protein